MPGPSLRAPRGRILILLGILSLSDLFSPGGSPVVALLRGRWPFPQRLRRTPPSLLLITIDTLRADHLSSYGYPRRTSPRIDALAAEGALFTRAYAQASWTVPCLYSLLSGLYPHMHRAVAWGHPLPDSTPTLAERLQARGYQTAFLTNHDVLLQAQPDLRRGFRMVWAASDGVCTAGCVTREALRWMRTRSARPYFLWIHYFDPHEPFSPPGPYGALFGEGSPGAERPTMPGAPEEALSAGSPAPALQHGETAAGVVDSTYGAGGIPRYILRGDERRISYYVDQYDGEIAGTDEAVGSLVDGLRALGAWEGTVVIITADHGEVLVRRRTPQGVPVYFSHGTYLYEELTRVPLVVISPPDVQPGLHSQEMVEHVDLLPTILDLLGLSADSGLPGRSLAPLFAGGRPEPRRYVLSEELRSGWFALRGERWKVIDYAGIREIFDLSADPGEARSLPSPREEAVRALCAEADRWRASGAMDPILPSGTIPPPVAEALRSVGYAN